MPNTLIKMKTGTITSLQSRTTSGDLVVPYSAGTVYFAISEDNTYGQIVFDTPSKSRVVMSTRAENADNATHATYAQYAELATALQNPRNFITDLTSTAIISFNGSANATLGVQGILPVSHGGTGASTFSSNGILIGKGASAIKTVVSSLAPAQALYTAAYSTLPV